MAHNRTVPSTRWRSTPCRRLLTLAAMSAACLCAVIVVPAPAAAAAGGGCANTPHNPYRLPRDMVGAGTPATGLLRAPISPAGGYPRGWIGDPAPGWFSAWSPGALHPSKGPGGSLQACADQRRNPARIGVDILGTCSDPCTLHVTVTINGTRKAAAAIPAVSNSGYQTSWSMSFRGPRRTHGGWPVTIRASLVWAGGKFTPRSGLTYRSF